MPDLIFTIKTPAELAGAEKAAQALGEAIGKAKGLGKEYAALEASLATTTASIAAYSQSSQAAGAVDVKATEETTKATAKARVGKEDLKRVVSALSNEYALLGVAGRLAMSPLVGGVLGVMYVINLARAEYKNFKTLMESSVDLSRLKSDLSGVKTAISGAKDEAGTFATKLSNAAAAQKSLKGDADEAVDSLTREAEQVNQLAEAYKRRALAELNYLKATGKITATQFEKRSADVENAFAAQANQRQTETDTKIIAVLQTKLDQANAERNKVAPQVLPAIDAANRAEAKAQRTEENKNTARENFNKQRDYIAGTKSEPGIQARVNAYADHWRISSEDRDRIGSFNNMDEFREAYPQADSSGRLLPFFEMTQKLKEERSRLEKLGAKVRDLDQKEEPQKDQAGQLRSRADALKNQLEKLESDARDLAQRLNKAETELQRFKPMRDTIQKLDQEARTIEAKSQVENLKADAREKFNKDTQRAFESGLPLPNPPQASVTPAQQLITSGFADASAGINQLTNTVVAGLAQLNQQLADSNTKLGDAANNV